MPFSLMSRILSLRTLYSNIQQVHFPFIVYDRTEYTDTYELSTIIPRSVFLEAFPEVVFYL